MNLLLKYKNYVIIGGLLLLLIVLVGFPMIFASSNPITSQEDLDPCNPTEIIGEAVDYIVVDVKGEVKKPGVYKLPKGSIIQDAIDKAGGLKKTAYTNNINLSKTLTNEMVVLINSKSEIKTTTTKKSQDITNNAEVKPITTKKTGVLNENNECVCEIPKDTSEDINLVNINTASKEELMTVKGIGASKADAIIIYRTDNFFSSIEDIKNVTGIGDSLFAKIKDYITV